MSFNHTGDFHLVRKLQWNKPDIMAPTKPSTSLCTPNRTMTCDHDKAERRSFSMDHFEVKKHTSYPSLPTSEFRSWIKRPWVLASLWTDTKEELSPLFLPPRSTTFTVIQHYKCNESLSGVFPTWPILDKCTAITSTQAICYFVPVVFLLYFCNPRQAHQELL